MKLLILLAGFIATTYACIDVYPIKCPNFKEYCNRAHMKQVCKKSCGVCTPPKFTPPPTLPTRATTVSQTAGKLPSQAPVSCGLRQVSSGKVIGGQDAKPGDWPWQVLLQKNGQGICGGTIINKRYVITAAHCVERDPTPQYFSIKVGKTDISKFEATEATYQAEVVVPHPDNGAFNADIAVIKLTQDIKFGKYVQPACLPNADIAVGSQNCFITGWGKIKHPGNMHTKLQQANMPPVRSDVCWRKNRKFIPWAITAGMVCAGEGGINPISGCHGDSGGPYVCEVNGRWVLHGAVSHGSRRCRSTETYTVFARINYFRQWIDMQIRIFGY